MAEIKAARVLLAERKAQLATLEQELKVAQENGKSLAKSYGEAVREITSLRASITHLEAAIEARVQLEAELREQRDAARKAEKKANKRAAITTAISIGLLLLRFL